MVLPTDHHHFTDLPTDQLQLELQPKRPLWKRISALFIWSGGQYIDRPGDPSSTDANHLGSESASKKQTMSLIHLWTWISVRRLKWNPWNLYCHRWHKGFCIYSICIVSMIRFKGLVTWTTQDGTYNNSMAILWTSLESMLGIICACIVIMRPLFGKVFPERLGVCKKTNKASTDPSNSSSSRLSRTPAWLYPAKHSRQLSAKATDPQVTSGPGKFQRLDEETYPLAPMREHMKPTHTTTVEAQNIDSKGGGVSDMEAQNPARSLSPSAIMVKREWEVDSLRVWNFFTLNRILFF